MKIKFTIQHMLWATVAFGLIALVMSAAYRGNMIATGMLIAPLVMAITFVVLAAIYWPCYLVSRGFYPPIHTSAPTTFSTNQTRHDNDLANPADTDTIPTVDEDVSTGAPE